ncbi:hypothetical protein [Paraburkholderia caribensis]|uniref:hypothetical protein n=1 Tax=Paraburkholderia caribensis TaxID=75105 RepID=UPI001E437CAB|nr:hypothetical protein [Paraburkholderia caribensis]
MVNFLLDLISNLIILAALLTACCVINWMRPDAKVDGYLVFVVFVAIALLFDAALTFLVFADSQARYGKFSTMQAFIPRLAAYATASGIAIGLSRMRSRKAAGRAGAHTVIRTSPPPIDGDGRRPFPAGNISCSRPRHRL